MAQFNISYDGVVEEIKDEFLYYSSMKKDKSYKYFYKQLKKMDENSIVQSTDLHVATSKLTFWGRIKASRTNGQKALSKVTTVDRFVKFEVRVANDQGFVQYMCGKFLYFQEAGADVISSQRACELAENAARVFFGDELLLQGYEYQGFMLERWEYSARALEQYTQYTLAYLYDKNETKYFSAIYYDGKAHIGVLPEPKRKR